MVKKTSPECARIRGRITSVCQGQSCRLSDSTNTQFLVLALVLLTLLVVVAAKFYASNMRNRARRQRAEADLHESRKHFELLVEGAIGYAIIMISPEGLVRSWNSGAQRMFGYRDDEIIDQPFARFFIDSDRERGLPGKELDLAREEGFATDDRWHVRKDGQLIWISGMVTPIRENNQLIGYGKVMRDRTDEKLIEEKMLHLAHFDPLTALFNRSRFYENLNIMLADALKVGNSIAVYAIDLDHFKKVNDNLGHHIGDLLLKQTSERMRECVDSDELIARLGGDEFVIAQTVAQSDDAARLAQKLVDRLAEPFFIEGREIHIGASVGIAMFPADTNDSLQLLKNADAAMYRSKQLGRATYQFFREEMVQRSVERIELENHLRHALARREFNLVFQPQVRIANGHLIGAEALLRWAHPGIGNIPPSRFIDLAEQSGLIVPIGEWVIRTACVEHQRWRDAGLPPLRVVVNLSARQLRQAQFVETVARVLSETGVKTDCLDLEITEGLLMEDTQMCSRVLNELKALGVHVSIDDFGTGYSSLNYLKNFAFDIMKIDQSFVRNVCTDEHDRAIISTIVTLAHSLKLVVIAEGVESRAQLEQLHELGCDAVQGNFFSPPLAPDEFVEFARGRIVEPLL